MTNPTDPADADPRSINTLRAIMAALRTPGTGCPWDLEQNFETIAPYTIEEAHEVAEAIAKADLSALKEELGDLLLQVVYHARLAEEHGAFGFDDVVEAISRKMVRRHPHVFGSAEARSAGVAKGFWEEMKAKERKPAEGRGTLDGVPATLPAMSRAVKLQAKAARVGFDWPHSGHVLEKIGEELRELNEAKRTGDPQHVSEELGDLLFAIANLARHWNIDPEASVRAANAKFERRFRAIEEGLAARGKVPADSSLEEMDALWNDAKRKER